MKRAGSLKRWIQSAGNGGIFSSTLVLQPEANRDEHKITFTATGGFLSLFLSLHLSYFPFCSLSIALYPLSSPLVSIDILLWSSPPALPSLLSRNHGDY